MRCYFKREKKKEKQQAKREWVGDGFICCMLPLDFQENEQNWT